MWSILVSVWLMWFAYMHCDANGGKNACYQFFRFYISKLSGARR